MKAQLLCETACSSASHASTSKGGGLKITSFPGYWCWPYAGAAAQSPTATFVTRHIASLSVPSAIKKRFHIKRKIAEFRIHRSGPGKSQSHSFILLSTARYTPESSRPTASIRAWKSDCWCFYSLYPSALNHITALLPAGGGTHSAQGRE